MVVGLNGDPLSLAMVVEGSLDATIDIASEDLGAAAVYHAHRAALGLPLPDVIPQSFQLITRDNVASVATRKLTAIAGIPSQMVGYNRQQEHDRLSQLEISMEITLQIGLLQEREPDQPGDQRSGAKALRLRVDQVSCAGQKTNKSFRSLEEIRLQLRIGSVSEADQLLNQAFSSNETVYIPDARTSRRWRIGMEWEPVRSRVLLPIQLGSETIGVLDLQSSQPVRKPSLEIVGLKLLASQLGIVIQNTDLYLEAIQARETAERADQLKNRLIANVGHEMRTPLNSILGFSQSIQKQLNSSQSNESKALSKISNTSTRAASI